MNITGRAVSIKYGYTYEVHMSGSSEFPTIAIARKDEGIVMDVTLTNRAHDMTNLRRVFQGFLGQAEMGLFDDSIVTTAEGHTLAPAHYEPTYEDYYGFPEDKEPDYDSEPDYDALADAELERQAEMAYYWSR